MPCELPPRDPRSPCSRQRPSWRRRPGGCCERHLTLASGRGLGARLTAMRQSPTTCLQPATGSSVGAPTSDDRGRNRLQRGECGPSWRPAGLRKPRAKEFDRLRCSDSWLDHSRVVGAHISERSSMPALAESLTMTNRRHSRRLCVGGSRPSGASTLVAGRRSAAIAPTAALSGRRPPSPVGRASRPIAPARGAPPPRRTPVRRNT